MHAQGHTTHSLCVQQTRRACPTFAMNILNPCTFFSPVDALWINRQQMAACQTSPEFVYRRLRPSARAVSTHLAKGAKNFAGSTVVGASPILRQPRCIQSSIPTDSVYHINGAAKKGAEKGKLFRPHLRVEKEKKLHVHVGKRRWRVICSFLAGARVLRCMPYIHAAIHVRRAEHN